MRTRIKICGIRDVATALAAVEAGADAIGLVFAPNSPRSVAVDAARTIVAALPAFVEPVGLFVDAKTSDVRQIAIAVGLRCVQLHGRESARDIAELQDLRIIKSLPSGPDYPQQRQALAPVRRLLAAILIDAPPPAGHAASVTGGHGQAFDWDDLARTMQKGPAGADEPPLILAGGLTPENVARAIAALRPYAVDVSSGVESSRGVKDPGLIRAFCQAVQAAS